jgi:hypothetical protein
LTTRDTVLMLTPASAATSRIVARARDALLPSGGMDNVVIPDCGIQRTIALLLHWNKP